jgi:hypothetical protein
MERSPALAVCKAIWLSAQVRSGHAPARTIDEDLDRLRDRPTAAVR